MAEMILTLNAGSSSIKFALFGRASPPVERARGQVEGIGTDPRLKAKSADGRVLADRAAPGIDGHEGALAQILALVDSAFPGAAIPVVGHRIVHGGPDHAAPEELTPAVMASLTGLEPFAPLHQPHNLAGVRAAMLAFPQAVQVGCFDTAFHRTQPWVAEAFALPQEFHDRGVRRYGFHGLSYDHIAHVLPRLAPDLAGGRVVVAHLGNGASLCVLKDGVAMGSTMGFTALDGVPMGTRCGQIDPGVLLWLMEQEGMDAAAITDLLYRRSGLLGVSGLSPDMRALEAAGTDGAERAITLFTTAIRRQVAGLAALVEGIDALVFTAGIGEHSARVRAEVCAGLGWLGLDLDAGANARGDLRISAPDSRVAALVIPTDEEMTIARAAMRLRP